MFDTYQMGCFELRVTRYEREAPIFGEWFDRYKSCLSKTVLELVDQYQNIWRGIIRVDDTIQVWCSVRQWSWDGRYDPVPPSGSHQAFPVHDVLIDKKPVDLVLPLILPDDVVSSVVPSPEISKVSAREKICCVVGCCVKKKKAQEIKN